MTATEYLSSSLLLASWHQISFHNIIWDDLNLITISCYNPSSHNVITSFLTWDKCPGKSTLTLLFIWISKNFPWPFLILKEWAPGKAVHFSPPPNKKSKATNDKFPSVLSIEWYLHSLSCWCQKTWCYLLLFFFLTPCILSFKKLCDSCFKMYQKFDCFCIPSLYPLWARSLVSLPELLH